MIAFDSYFATHRAAQFLAEMRRPFIGLCGKKTKWVADIGKDVPQGQLGMAHNGNARHKYALFVFKAPKLTKRAAKMVPLLSNAFEAEGLSTARAKPSAAAKDIPYVVQVYRDLAQTVDRANQMALRFRQQRRNMSWSQVQPPYPGHQLHSPSPEPECDRTNEFMNG